MEDIVSPRIFRLDTKESREELKLFLEQCPEVQIRDTLETQLRDYVCSRHPSIELRESDLEDHIQDHLGTCSIEGYGSWVYYPWTKIMLRLLPEQEFASLRTDRNKNKITEEEQQILSKKKIGIIGLSVGHSVATALALERGFGELRVADYDVLDLSNLNRIASGVQNIGLSKTTIVSREIAELDPYLDIQTCPEGISDSNLIDFLTSNGQLDLLIDECDSLPIKLKCREIARKLGIPVIMGTSDKGMIDVERFDIDASLPLLHGLVGDLSSEDVAALSPEKRIDLVKKILDFDRISDRLKQSLAEIGKTISTWPQLGSDVMLGGASVALVSRKILLGESVKSGRYYFDIEEELNN